MRIIRLCVYFCFLAGSVSLNTQPVPQWINRFNGFQDSTDIAIDITVDSAGNSYVTGSSYNLLGLLIDIYTTSYAPDGSVRWYAEFDGGLLLNDAPSAIILDNTQQYVYVVGYANSLLSLTPADYVIIKYDANFGTEQWVRTYNGGLLADDRATAIAIDNQNNPVITGKSQSFLLIFTPYDYATIKYNPAGVQQWVSRYNGLGNGEDVAYAITVDGIDNVIVTGSSWGSGTGFDYATVKYNPAGSQQWTSRYNGTGNDSDRAYAIIVDGSDNVIVTGESEGSTTGFDYATIKYNPAGNQQWASRYNGPGNGEDRAYAIIVDGSDNPIVTGESGGSGSGSDYATIKYNSAGSQQWFSRYNGPGNSEDRAYAIIVDGTDNVYVTGSSRSTNAPGSEDYATLKYSQAGGQSWVVSYNGTGNNEDRPYAIIVDGSDNVFITGSSRNGSLLGSEDYLTIKYAPEANPVIILSNQVPVKNSLSQNYPNPFNPKTQINFDIAVYSNVKIAVYDVLGNEIDVILNNNLNPGTYAVQWDGTARSSGIYFYRISVDGYTETKKLILTK